MQRNVGGLDRGVRIVFGPILLVAAIRSLLSRNGRRPSRARATLAVGAYLTATGLLGTCPANSLLGRDTSRQGELTDEAQTVRERAIQ